MCDFFNSAIIFHLFTLRNRFTVKVTQKEGESETCAIADLSCYILTIAQSCQLRIAKLFIIANFKVAICFAVAGIYCRLINCDLRSEQKYFFIFRGERGTTKLSLTGKRGSKICRFVRFVLSREAERDRMP